MKAAVNVPPAARHQQRAWSCQRGENATNDGCSSFASHWMRTTRLHRCLLHSRRPLLLRRRHPMKSHSIAALLASRTACAPVTFPSAALAPRCPLSVVAALAFSFHANFEKTARMSWRKKRRLRPISFWKGSRWSSHFHCLPSSFSNFRFRAAAEMRETVAAAAVVCLPLLSSFCRPLLNLVVQLRELEKLPAVGEKQGSSCTGTGHPPPAALHFVDC